MFRVEGTKQKFKFERHAVEAFFGTSAVIALGLNMWLNTATGATCTTVKESA